MTSGGREVDIGGGGISACRTLSSVMKLIANSWNSMSSTHGIPSRVNVKAVGSHSGWGTRESSTGISNSF